MKLCPECGSTRVIMFDSDNDLCEKCRKWFPAVGDVPCHKGCKTYGEKELRHHKDCFYYPKSFSKMYDDEREKNKNFRKGIKRIIIEIQEQILQSPIDPNIGKKVQLLDGRFKDKKKEED